MSLRNFSRLFHGLTFIFVVLLTHPSDAGNPITARSGHTSTVLLNGKVLVAGGYQASKGIRVSKRLSSAELYDPATDTWSSTGSLSTPRVEFTATLLQNGKVLVAGGGENDPLDSAELYDPATGTWSLTGKLIQARSYHAAALLKNGTVLVVGGENRGNLSTAELYDPVTGSWSPTGSLNVARSFHAATRLLNGKVLVAGGYAGGTSAELYDPATGTWSLTGELSTSYYWHTATLLPISGKVLFVGSHWFDTIRTTELYDPITGKWSLTGSLNVGRVYHASILLSGDKVLVMGGYDNPSSTFYDSVELYQPDSETWTFVSNLKTPRLNSATTLQNGKVLVVGTEINSTNPIDELYKARIRLPKITAASKSGKKLFVFGKNFEPGAVILINGKEQKTEINDQNTLIATKSGKKVKAGKKLQVRNLNSTLSKEFTFTDQL
ncbi:hypothetical protein L0222_05605 [bacterium]|nr:hypothetical protein [bacterium]